MCFFFFQAEDGIRDLVRSRGLGDVYKRQMRDDALRIASSCNRAELPDIGDPTEIALLKSAAESSIERLEIDEEELPFTSEAKYMVTTHTCLLYTSDAADERSSVDLGGRRIIKKKTKNKNPDERSENFIESSHVQARRSRK